MELVFDIKKLKWDSDDCSNDYDIVATGFSGKFYIKSYVDVINNEPKIAIELFSEWTQSVDRFFRLDEAIKMANTLERMAIEDSLKHSLYEHMGVDLNNYINN